MRHLGSKVKFEAIGGLFASPISRFVFHSNAISVANKKMRFVASQCELLAILDTLKWHIHLTWSLLAHPDWANDVC